MMSYIYMLGSWMLNGIFAKVDSTCIIIFNWNVIKFYTIVQQCCFYHKTYEQHKLAAIYSASTVDKATKTCFLLNQETKHYPKTWQVPKVLFLSNKLPVKSS